MSYMTMEEQITSHIAFLKNEQIAINELQLDKGFIRCDIVGTSGRGELCYQTKKTLLKNGLIGLSTWLRTKGGEIKTHKTYGLSSSWKSLNDNQEIMFLTDKQEAIKKAKFFWDMSSQIGSSEYLLKKGVGYYGIRFRQTDYGKIAVIPMKDIGGEICSYQLINANGSKRFAKDVSTTGLLHMLHQPINGFPIGLAESYVTAASCFETTGMAMVTSFSSENLKLACLDLRRQFPESPLIILADDDRHLTENKGKCSALKAYEEVGMACKVVIPDFTGYPGTREFSDWNDYLRENGVMATREAIKKLLDRS